MAAKKGSSVPKSTKTGTKGTKTNKVHIKTVPKGTKTADHRAGTEFNALVDRCITSFADVFNDSLALDLNRVGGKLRSMVLQNERYRQETKMLRADMYAREIKDLDEIIRSTDSEDVVDEFDVRKRKKGASAPKRTASIDRDLLQMRFKAKEARRRLIFKDDENSDKSEADALNVFFINVTEDEFKEMETVELFTPETNEKADLGNLVAEQGQSIDGSVQ
jgi:hypothetical protein